TALEGLRLKNLFVGRRERRADHSHQEGSGARGGDDAVRLRGGAGDLGRLDRGRGGNVQAPRQTGLRAPSAVRVRQGGQGLAVTRLYGLRLRCLYRKIRSVNNDDEVRRGQAQIRCRQRAGWRDGSRDAYLTAWGWLASSICLPNGCASTGCSGYPRNNSSFERSLCR